MVDQDEVHLQILPAHQPFRQSGHTQSFVTLDMYSLLSFVIEMKVHQHNSGEPQTKDLLHMPQVTVLDTSAQGSRVLKLLPIMNSS
ncbi:MAG: hypothetical protein M1327_04195 [Candidatus Thermoplasmatota archaeon]|nr:hypothetical protein [Candidatus Thermoplasmatota archaeon]